MRVMLFGASGLVGGLLVPRLASHDLVAVGRRATGFAGERVVPVADWSAIITELRPDVIVSTLGTTIAKAGSRAAFAAVDHDTVLAVARAGRAAGARQFLVVSSVGAKVDSGNFYLATKGRAEASLVALGYPRLDIFRPGLLLGSRSADPRLGERVGILLSPLTNALTPRRFDRFRAIAADDVAAAIARLVGKGGAGTYIHHNRDMLEPAVKLA